MPQMNFQQRILLVTSVLLLLLTQHTTNIFAGEATLSWDANSEADLAGYNIHYGTSSQNYGPPITVGKVTTHTLTGLTNGTTYYFALTAYDTSTNESGFSAEVSKDIPGGDTTAPLLSEIEATNITETGIDITWSSDEAASSLVEYGTTTFDSSSTLGTTLVTNHLRALSDLDSNTTYQYRVVSRDAAGNTATSGNFTFTTDPAPDTTPPMLSDILVLADNIGQNSAIVTWNTDESATSLVEYGTDSNYGSSSVFGSTLVTSHSRILSSLIPDTTYHYRVISSDTEGNAATSRNFTFTTDPAPDTTPPMLSDVSADNIGQNSATVTWNTDESATSRVEYGTNSDYGNFSAQNNTL
ncbi:MAG: hypothetical protein GXO96_06965, partial [Nitrospirae bacterium]|nr:hypothetical protein [Candidatus Manganitrophaceae bacterium]